MKPEELIKQIEEKLYSVDINPELVNYGVVETVGDGIVKATGLSSVGYGEEVEFENKEKAAFAKQEESENEKCYGKQMEHLRVRYNFLILMS